MTAHAIEVRFLAQGGNEKTGRAIARKGGSLLIAYTIQTGEARERWIPPKRILETQGSTDSLPRYRSRSCPGYTLDEPTKNPDECPACGHLHRWASPRVELFYEDTGEIIATRDGVWCYGPLKFGKDAGLDIEWRNTGAHSYGYPVHASYLGDRIVETRSLALAMASRKLPDELVGEKK